MKQMALRRWLILAFGLVVVLGLTQLPRLLSVPPGSAAIGGPFTLTDQSGRTVSDSEFRGKLMLIYFGYSFCPDVCPTTLTQMVASIGELTPEQQAQIVPIFVTVDPERDDVAQMAQYVASFSPGLIGLTGTPQQIAAVTKQYHVYAKKAGSGAGYSVDHSSIIYLMDKKGGFLRHFDGTANSAEIAGGLRQALR